MEICSDDIWYMDQYDGKLEILVENIKKNPVFSTDFHHHRYNSVTHYRATLWYML